MSADLIDGRSAGGVDRAKDVIVSGAISPQCGEGGHKSTKGLFLSLRK